MACIRFWTCYRQKIANFSRTSISRIFLNSLQKIRNFYLDPFSSYSRYKSCGSGLPTPKSGNPLSLSLITVWKWVSSHKNKFRLPCYWFGTILSVVEVAWALWKWPASTKINEIGYFLYTNTLEIHLKPFLTSSQHRISLFDVFRALWKWPGRCGSDLQPLKRQNRLFSLHKHTRNPFLTTSDHLSIPNIAFWRV